MAINFTDSPADGATQVISGRTYTYNSAKNKWDTTATEVVGPTATVYATVDNLPETATTGDQAFVSGTNRLYIWNGSGWYNIALINTNPIISGVSSSYALAADGTATTVTITATDPEGLPITYSIASDTSGNIATVTQGTGASSNVFTVTPSTNTANAGSFTLTFRASDGVNLATAPASFTLQFSVENSNYTTALITSVGANNAVNNSFDDASTNNHTITAIGNATQTTFSPYRHGGYSTYFDGSGDYLTASLTTDFNVGTNDFTIEFWGYLNATGQFHEPFGLGADTSNGLVVDIHSSNYIRLLAYIGGSWGAVITGSTTLSANQWYHIAVVRNGNDFDIYLNGTKDATTVTNSGSITDPSGGNQISVGGYQLASTAWRYFNGYISDLRFVNGTAVYTSNFTPSTERLTAITNTKFLTCHLPYIADGSSTGHSITVNGNTKTEPFAAYDYQEYSSSNHGGSMYFDGSGDYLAVTNDTSLELESSDFTVEAWVYMTAYDSTGFNAFVLKGAGDATNNSYQFDYRNGTTELRFIPYVSDSADLNLIATTTLSLNTWYHVAAVRNGSSWALYKNGVSVATYTASITIDTSTAGLHVGSRGAYADRLLNGYITDVRVIKGTAVYTSAFTPPTAPLTAITNTSLLLSGTDAGIIDKSQSSKDLVLNADTKCSSTQSKYRSTSIYMDGTGDTLQFGEDNPETILDWGVGGSPFTVEWWQYDTMPTSTNHVVGPCIGGAAASWSGTNGHQYLNIFDSNNFYVQWWGTNNAVNSVNVAASSMNFIQNQWQHIASVYDGSTYKIYIDGTEEFSTTVTNTFKANSGQRFGILGSINGGAYITAAYYDDLRITKGLARYTANFTPPAAALQA